LTPVEKGQKSFSHFSHNSYSEFLEKENLQNRDSACGFEWFGKMSLLRKIRAQPKGIRYTEVREREMLSY